MFCSLMSVFMYLRGFEPFIPAGVAKKPPTNWWLFIKYSIRMTYQNMSNLLNTA